MQLNTKNSYQKLNDAELLKLTLNAAKTEKAATLALLDYLVEVDSRRLYATVNACSSLFDYLVKELGFSHPAAAERVNTVRLIRAVPLVKNHLESGNLTLTSAAQIQRFVNAEQKVDPKGRAVSTEKKEKVIDACLGKSKREVEKTLFEKHSEPARILTQEKVRAITAHRSEIKFSVDEVTLEKLQQFKDLAGDQPLEKIFDQALDALLIIEKKKRGVVESKNPVSQSKMNPNKLTDNHAARGQPADLARIKARAQSKAQAQPGVRPQSEAQLNSRFIPIDLKRIVFARSKGQCEYLDPQTKNRCHVTYPLQIDHRIHLALGGKTEATNLRHLCPVHHLRMAAQIGLHRPEKTLHH